MGQGGRHYRRAAHGLREACCRRLAELGCTIPQIMAISGHKSLAEVERYIKAASQKLLAHQAIARMEACRPRAIG